MGLLFPGRKTEIADQAVLRAKQDSSARAELLRNHRAFILRVVCRACRRYASEQDDEFSVALIAFDEAITSYQSERAASFTTFAEQVIRRRLIDWQRKQRRPEIAWSELSLDSGETPVIDQLTASASLAAYQAAQESLERRDEIARLNAELGDYGISFLDLVHASPHHRDARESAKQAALLLVNRGDLLSRLRQSKALPQKDLLRLVSVSRKTLERQRKYIIALAIVLAGDYPQIKSFVEWPAGGE